MRAPPREPVPQDDVDLFDAVAALHKVEDSPLLSRGEQRLLAQTVDLLSMLLPDGMSPLDAVPGGQV